MHARRLTAGAAALVCAVAPAAAPARADTYGDRLGAHSMLYLTSTPEQHRALFRAARETQVRSIRLDFTMGAVFRFLQPPEYAAVDRVNRLARRYRLQVDAVITGLPFWLAGCPPGTELAQMSNCALRADAQAEAEWSQMVFDVVRRSPSVRYWELGNEPDVRSFFIGTPAQYARMATVTARAIRAARPSATIVLGGTSRLDRRFLRAVLHDDSNPLAEQIDVAAVHLRGALSGMGRLARASLRFFRSTGFRGPLWVTETGYPSEPAHQWDPSLTGGERDQARWIARGPRALLAGGCDRVFVTLRDGPEFGPQSAFASEGIVHWPELTADGRAIPKPAFAALRRVAMTPG